MGQSAVMDMEISNLSDSGRNVMVRVVSDDYKQILAFEMLVPCGEAVVFPLFPPAGASFRPSPQMMPRVNFF